MRGQPRWPIPTTRPHPFAFTVILRARARTHFHTLSPPTTNTTLGRGPACLNAHAHNQSHVIWLHLTASYCIALHRNNNQGTPSIHPRSLPIPFPDNPCRASHHPKTRSLSELDLFGRITLANFSLGPPPASSNPPGKLIPVRRDQRSLLPLTSLGVMYSVHRYLSAYVTGMFPGKVPYPYTRKLHLSPDWVFTYPAMRFPGSSHSCFVILVA
ncbi:hypothetical protein LX36DRAFT_151919 [Colletotrichum falcatum]|nr:hypothetical protein LX36DRAFT_151919 [Colletotrichum falcatum]